MTFKKSWDVADIVSQIRNLTHECSTPYNDGFFAFECKKDLYQLKKILDDALAKAPDFGEIEIQWLHEQEKKHIIKILQS